MKEKIIEIIQEACALDDVVSVDTKLQDISMDSLSFVEAIVKIEQEFDIEFGVDEAELTYWDTVGDIILKVKELYCEKK